MSVARHRPDGTRRHALLVALRIGDSTAGIYGTLLTLSVLVGLSIDPPGAGVMTVTVAVSVAVFWLAHVHAELVARWIRSGTSPDRAAIVAMMLRESPMLESALPVIALLILAWLGLIGVTLAGWLGVAWGVVALVGWGLLIARKAHLGTLGVLVVAGINLALGGLIVLLKLLVH